MMKKIIIENDLSTKLPSFTILAYTMSVRVEGSFIVEDEIKRLEAKIRADFTLEEVLSIKTIKEARDGYKKLGKDPSRYRLATESLFRRIVKGNELYRINNVVDSGNILSLSLGRSTAVLDLDKIDGDVHIRLGNEEDEYYGIGRGLINVANIPLYVDNISPFGSPTSDTERTMITEETTNILLMIICFSHTDLEKCEKEAYAIFKNYAYARNIKKIEVITT